jgi:hypothetical protein
VELREVMVCGCGGGATPLPLSSYRPFFFFKIKFLFLIYRTYDMPFDTRETISLVLCGLYVN